MQPGGGLEWQGDLWVHVRQYHMPRSPPRKCDTLCRRGVNGYPRSKPPAAMNTTQEPPYSFVFPSCVVPNPTISRAWAGRRGRQGDGSLTTWIEGRRRILLWTRLLAARLDSAHTDAKLITLPLIDSANTVTARHGTQDDRADRHHRQATHDRYFSSFRCNSLQRWCVAKKQRREKIHHAVACATCSFGEVGGVRLEKRMRGVAHGKAALAHWQGLLRRDFKQQCRYGAGAGGRCRSVVLCHRALRCLPDDQQRQHHDHPKCR